MNIKPNIKKKIAKEILIFFSALFFLAIIWGLLVLRNIYCENKMSTLKNELVTITSQIKKSPTDQIKEIYDAVNRNFVVHYNVNGQNFTITKDEEPDFLKDNPRATKLALSPIGYAYLKKDAWKMDGHYYFAGVEYWRPLSDAVAESIGAPIDSVIVFDHVELDIFRKYLANIEYRNYLHKFIHWKNIDIDNQSPYVDKVYGVLRNAYREKFTHTLQSFRQKISVDSSYQQKIYGIMKAAFGNQFSQTSQGFVKEILLIDFELGTGEEFEKTIEMGLCYTKENAIALEQLMSMNTQLEEQITQSEISFERSKNYWGILSMVVTFLLFILYPLRLCYNIVIWSINTVKQKSE